MGQRKKTYKYGISVIIPTGKGKISRMLDSILNQTFKNYEIIIINDGPLDKAQDIMDAYISEYSNIRLFEQENQGIIREKARVISAVLGEYVLMVDDDDYLEETALEKLYFKAVAEQADMVYYGFYEIHEGIKQHYPPRNDVNYFHLNYYPLWSKLIKTEYLENLKYDKLPAISQFEDSMISFLLGVFQPKIAILKENLYWYNQPESSAEKLFQNDAYATDAITAFTYLRSRFKELGIYELYHSQLCFYLNDLKKGIDQNGNEKVKAQFTTFFAEMTEKLKVDQVVVKCAAKANQNGREEPLKGTIKLLLSMVVKNEAGRFLELALESAKQYVDFVLVIDDASTDKTVELCEKILADFPHQIIRNKTSMFENETKLRSFLWQESLKLNAEWIMILDADEVFEETIAHRIKELLSTDKDAIYFRLYDFWDKAKYRDDALWNAHHYYRPFIVRHKKNLPYNFPDVAQHCGRFPIEVKHFEYELSEIRLKHLGWSRKEDRKHKFERYMRLDPKGEFGDMRQYLSILDESPKLIPFDGSKKVLVGSPVHQKPGILQEFLNGLSKLESNGLDIHYFFVDDNEDQYSSQLLKDFQNNHENVILLENTEGLEFNPESHHWRNEVILKVGKNKDKIFDYARKHQFDFVFLADSDLVLHPSTLTHLVSLEKEVVSEVFYTAWTAGGMEMPQVWLYDTYEFTKDKNLPQEKKTEIFMKFVELLKQPGVYPVGGLGACTMIAKSALDKGVSFVPIYNLSFWGEDRHFCVRAAALGIELFASTTYAPLHIYRESDLDKVADFWQRVKAGETNG